MKRDRYIELDIMKFWGILLVVLAHVTNFYTPSPLITPALSSALLADVSVLVYSFHMPLFVFVSGCVYSYQREILHKGNSDSLIVLIKKKSKRLLVPYLFFGVVMAVLLVELGLRDNVLDYAYNGFFLSKDSRHLWFVLMLFEVFVLVWLMIKLVEMMKTPKWALLIISFIGYLSASVFPYIFQINCTFRYQFWFVLGYVFILYKNLIHKVIMHYIAGGVILVVCLFQRQHIEYSIPFFSTIVAMSGIMLFYQLSCDMKFVSSNRFFQIISRNSFGIYLYHVPFIYLLFYYLADYQISPYILSTFIFLLSLFISIVMTELTRRVGLGFVIGEK